VTGPTQTGASIEVSGLIKLTDEDQRILINFPPENLELGILNPVTPAAGLVAEAAGR